ncbi:MAG: diadenylate cyclase [Methanomicrobia archaeon]|nr:diadenylate cyclase [Methanomicrobia archaeon]MCK4636762.1 diadenylate cyclase [Methanomicrobia archaeon]
MNAVLIKKALELKEESKSDALIVYTNSKKDLKDLKSIKNNNIVIITNNKDLLKKELELPIILMPIELSRIKRRIALAMAAALENKLIEEGYNVVFVENTDRYKIISIEKAKEGIDYGIYKLLSKSRDIDPEVIYSVLEITKELGIKGREGEPVGTTFIIGDSGNVMRRSMQITYNPFESSFINVKDPVVKSMLKEYSRLDGVFIIGDDGRVVSAARYLESGKNDIEMPKGLGARHISAAYTTKVADAIAIVLSESDKMIRIFSKGKLVLEVDPEEL